MLSKQKRKHYYKTLGTNIVNSSLSSLSLIFSFVCSIWNELYSWKLALSFHLIDFFLWWYIIVYIIFMIFVIYFPDANSTALDQYQKLFMMPVKSDVIQYKDRPIQDSIHFNWPMLGLYGVIFIDTIKASQYQASLKIW